LPGVSRFLLPGPDGLSRHFERLGNYRPPRGLPIPVYKLPFGFFVKNIKIYGQSTVPGDVWKIVLLCILPDPGQANAIFPGNTENPVYPAFCLCKTRD
jgi:hypothetical protein